MFAVFRRLSEAIEALAEVQRQAGPATHRLAKLEQLVVDLELSRAKWEVEVEATLLRAEGKLKAAANAEARERTMRKTYGREADPFADESEGVEAPAAPAGDDEGSEEKRVPDLLVGMAPDSKANALRQKFFLG